MNRERAKELLPVIQAFAEGATVEYRLGDKSEWMADPHQNYTFGVPGWHYRVKPAPRIVPYTIDELADLVGQRFRCKASGTVALLARTFPTDNGVSCDGYMTVAEFHEKMEHFDGVGKPGRPIGKVVE